VASASSSIASWPRSTAVSTGRLNEAVKRNAERFPADFMFQLTAQEIENLKSQFAISSWGGRRYRPFAFTEHGAHPGSQRSQLTARRYDGASTSCAPSYNCVSCSARTKNWQQFAQLEARLEKNVAKPMKRSP